MKLAIDKNQGIDDRGRAFGFIWDKDNGQARGLFFTWPDDRARANVRAAATALAAVAENDSHRRDAAYALRQWA